MDLRWLYYLIGSRPRQGGTMTFRRLGEKSCILKAEGLENKYAIFAVIFL